jgi:hypothetical protein
MSGDNSNFEDLVDRAAEQAVSSSAHVSLSVVTGAQVKPTSLYVVDGNGLWRPESDTGGVTLKRLFSSQELRLDWPLWRDHCVAGRIREVKS